MRLRKAGMQEYSYQQFYALRECLTTYQGSRNSENRSKAANLFVYMLQLMLEIGVVFACPAIAMNENRPNKSNGLFSSAAPRIPTFGDASRAIRGRPLVPSRPDDEQHPGS